jgi:flagellin-like protein
MTKTGKKRAVDPVIATLILIVVAVVAGIAVYGFIDTFISAATLQTQAPSSIMIDTASLSTTQLINITVRNIGQINADLVSTVYILKASDLSLEATATVTWNTDPLPPTGLTGISSSVSLSSTISSGRHVIKVVTSDGASAAIVVEAS